MSENTFAPDQLPAEPKTPVLTFGQKAVGINFNPGGDPLVNDVKQKFADILDIINDSARSQTNEPYLSNFIFNAAISQTMSAQMAVIKLVTWKL